MNAWLPAITRQIHLPTHMKLTIEFLQSIVLLACRVGIQKQCQHLLEMDHSKASWKIAVEYENQNSEKFLAASYGGSLSLRGTRDEIRE
jgi:hypothetical protein